MSAAAAAPVLRLVSVPTEGAEMATTSKSSSTYFDAHARLRLAEIEPRDVKAFVRWMNEQEDPRRPGRLLGKPWIRQHVAVLRALLGDAMEEGGIRSNRRRADRRSRR